MNKITGYFLWLAIVVFAGSKAIKLMTTIGSSLSGEIFTTFVTTIAYVALCSFALSALIYKLMYLKTATSLDEYKRELEKKSIDKTESSSKIKVLESKIAVLEKALEQALGK